MSYFDELRKKEEEKNPYLAELDKAVRKKSKIKRALEKDAEFEKYMIALGMNPEWVHNAAAMGIIRNRFSRILKEGAGIRIRKTEFFYNKGDNHFGKLDRDGRRFLLGETGEYLTDIEPGEDDLATGKGFIKYVYRKSNTNYQERLISPDGVVIHQFQRFGGSGKVPNDEDWIQLIELTRDPNGPYINRHEVFRPAMSEPQVRDVKEYDYAYPITIEKNGTVHKKTPDFFSSRYPRYESWFMERYRNRERFINKVFDMQDASLMHVFDKHLQTLAQTMEATIDARERLNFAYTEIIKAFNQSRGGAIYRGLFMMSLNSFFEEDPLHLFYDGEEKDAIREAMLERLANEPVDEEELAERIAKDKKAIVSKVRTSEHVQDITSVFGERKSIEDDDYSFEEALKDVQERSTMIEAFDKSDENPFAQEHERLKEKLRIYGAQQKALVAANRSVPFVGKKIKNKVAEKVEGSERPVVRKKKIFDPRTIIGDDHDEI